MTQQFSPSGRALRHVRDRRRAVLAGAAALAALSAAPGVVRAATWNGGAGNWNTAANWTGGVPNSAGATAVIDGGNAVASVVTLDISPSITSVTIDAGDTLVIGNGQLLTLSGGGTVNGTLTINSAGSFTRLRFTGAQTLGGSGQVQFGGTVSNNIIDGTGPLTIGPALTMRTAAQGGSLSTTAVTNQGVLSAETAGMTFAVDPTTFVNQGTVRASAGTFVIGAGSWTNTGRLEISGTGLLRLGGSVKTAGLNLPGFVRTGGTVEVNGLIDNTGATLALAANTGSFNLVNSGTIKGGTVTSAGGAALVVPGGVNTTLDGVTLDTDVPIGNGSVLNVQNGMTIATGRTLTVGSVGSFTRLRFNGAQTLGGSGQVVFGGTVSNNLVDGTGPVTIGPGISFRTGSQGGALSTTAVTNQGVLSAETAGMTFTVDPTTFVNQGTAQVSAGTLVIGASSWTNTGTLSISGTGLLRLGGSVKTAGLNLPGFARSGGTIEVNGLIDNTGAILALAANTGSFNLVSSGTIKGGTVTATGGAALVVPGGVNTTLDGVTLDTDLPIGNGSVLNVQNGLTLAAGRTLTVGSIGSFTRLRFNGAQTLGGSGQVLFGGTVSNNLIDGTGPVTIGPGVAIRTGAQGGSLSTTGVTNQGVLSAETVGMTFTIDPTTFVNQGTVQVSAGTLQILASSWTNTGQLNVSGGLLRLGGSVTTAGLNLPGFVRTGGTIEVNGLIDNTGATLTLTANTGSFNLVNSGTIKGGTVTAAGGAALVVPGGINTTLDGVTLDTDVPIGNGSVLNVQNGLTVSAGRTLTVGSTGSFTRLRFNGAQTLGGSGQVLFGGSVPNNLIDGTGPVTIGPAMSIRTGAQGGGLSTTGVTNQGVLSAETAGTTFTIDSTTFLNQGTVRASAGTFAIAASSWTNTGRIEVSGTALMRLGGTVTTAGLNLPGFVRTGGTIEVNGLIDNTGAILALAANTGSFNLVSSGTIKGGTVTAAGGAALLVPGGVNTTVDGVTLDTDVTIGNGSVLNVQNGLTIAAGRTVTIASAGSFTRLRFNGTQPLGGGGQVLFGGSVSNNIIDGTGPLTIGPGIAIRTGTQGGSLTTTGVINQGLLSAATAGMSFGVDGTTFVNQGTVQASAGTFSITAASWTNTGTFNISGTGLLRLGGSFKTTGLNLPGFVRTGGTVDVVGTLDNTGATLALAANTGVFNLRAGTIKGGTVTASGGAGLVVPAGTTGTLDAVTLDTDLPVGNGSVLSAQNSLTITGGHVLTVASTGSFTRLRFDGAQTLGGAGQVVFGGTVPNNLIDGTGPLTIGPTMTVRTGGSGGTISIPTVTNNGVIAAQDPGQTIAISSTTFVNNGTLRAQAGGTLLIDGGLSGTATGSLTVGPSGTVRAAFIRQASLSLQGTAGSPATFGRVQILAKAQGGQTSVVKSMHLALGASNNPLFTFNLADTALIVDYDGASPIASVRAALASGYAGGLWNGAGINSSSIGVGGSRGLGYAEATEVVSPLPGTFQGQPADATSVVVRFTLYGDANLSGNVDFADLVQLAQHYNTNVLAGSQSTWFQGDFTYDGLVDFNDLVKMAQNYNTALPGEPVPGAPARFGDDLARAFASVPEPGAAGFLLAVASCRRRRRR